MSTIENPGGFPPGTSLALKIASVIVGVAIVVWIGLAITLPTKTDKPVSPACDHYAWEMATYGEDDLRGQAAAVLWESEGC